MSDGIKISERLGAAFFERNIHEVARDLLGCELVRVVGGEELRGRIREVEVYEGENDAASHAKSGEPTERTAPMFAAPGTVYVYTIYGMYQCLNLRAPSRLENGEGPGAILIRACEPVAGKAAMAVGRGLVDSADEFDERLVPKLMSGPGKLCQALSIGTELSGSMIGDEIALEAGEMVCGDDIEKTERVGLNPKTCGECVEWLWRYKSTY